MYKRYKYSIFIIFNILRDKSQVFYRNPTLKNKVRKPKKLPIKNTTSTRI